MSCIEFGLLKLIRQIRAATKFESVFSLSKFQITFLVIKLWKKSNFRRNIHIKRNFMHDKDHVTTKKANWKNSSNLKEIMY